MNAALAGIFDPYGRASAVRLDDALAPHRVTIEVAGPLRVAHGGPAGGSSRPMCMLTGAIDNAAELNAELGCRPGTSLKELLSAGWRRWGDELPGHLRGDFALVVWDPEQEKGLLARDQIGVRSMYLHNLSGGLFFATEVRHLLALLPTRPAPDPVGVAHWIALNGRPGSGTLYSGIRRLDPGGIVILRSGEIRERRYWTPRFVEPMDLSASDLSARVRDSIGRAVQRRLDPAGPTGIMMSGGLDSASVAAVASARAPGRVFGYSAVFPGYPELDESILIRELRASLGVPGTNAEVKPGGLVRSGIEAIQSWQLPLSSWGDFWASALLRAASSVGVHTMLGGDGGDELFGARTSLLADRLRAAHPLQALALARELPGAGDQPSRRAVARVVRDWGLANAVPYRLHNALRRREAGADLSDWMLPATKRDFLSSYDPLAWKRLDGPRWWAEAVHVLLRGVEEAGYFEEHRHRAAKAEVEARHPLFDLDVVEIGLGQPPEKTFDRYMDRPILRASMEGLLTDTIRLRPVKARFDSLLVDSLTGPDRAVIEALLSGPKTELGAFVDLDGVRRSLLAHGAGADAPFLWMRQLWRLVTIECWLRSQSAQDLGSLPTALSSSAEIRLQIAAS